MTTKEILSRVDHTLLSPTATLDEIKAILDGAREYGTASACIPPYYVKAAKKYVGDDVKICTVIGFPLGYSTTATKVAECRDAVEMGADEIDMVANIGLIKSGEYELVKEEIQAVKQAAAGRILKVIIETCLLTDEQTVKMCEVVYRGGADYIKTSTGFSHGGATPHHVELMRKSSSPNLKIKAAGGISTLADAERFIELGAERLGTSRIVNIIKKEKENGERKELPDTSY